MTWKALPAVLIMGAACACALTALLWQGGRWVGDLDALTHFAPIVLIVGLAAAAMGAGLSVRGRRLMAAAAAVLLLCGGERIAPELAARLVQASRPAPAGARFRVVQFNLRQRNVDVRGTLAWIRAQHADVLILEEATGPSQFIVKALRPIYPYRSTCAGKPICPTLILSKVAPVEAGGLRHADVPVRAAWAVLPSSSGPVSIVGVHLTWPFPAGLQQTQAAGLTARLAGLPRERMIVTGDFNSTPWSFSLRRLDGRLGLQRLTHGQASFPARFDRWPFPAPLFAIDQVYAGPGWRLARLRRGPRLGSDHYPLVVDLVALPAK